MKELDRFDRKQLVDDFAEVINKRSIENFSNTPDFILAEYLVRCLENWNQTTVQRNTWFRPGPDGKTIIDPLQPRQK
jgi:hypothetical protein